MTTTAQFDNVSVIKRANIYFDGKCVSHTILLGDGTRKTLVQHPVNKLNI